jgi:hypothetical protein
MTELAFCQARFQRGVTHHLNKKEFFQWPMLLIWYDDKENAQRSFIAVVIINTANPSAPN